MHTLRFVGEGLSERISLWRSSHTFKISVHTLGHVWLCACKPSIENRGGKFRSVIKSHFWSFSVSLSVSVLPEVRYVTLFSLPVLAFRILSNCKTFVYDFYILCAMWRREWVRWRSFFYYFWLPFWKAALHIWCLTMHQIRHVQLQIYSFPLCNVFLTVSTWRMLCRKLDALWLIVMRWKVPINIDVCFGISLRQQITSLLFSSISYVVLL